jgi:hypothetical protein
MDYKLSVSKHFTIISSSVNKIAVPTIFARYAGQFIDLIQFSLSASNMPWNESFNVRRTTCGPVQQFRLRCSSPSIIVAVTQWSVSSSGGVTSSPSCISDTDGERQWSEVSYVPFRRCLHKLCFSEVIRAKITYYICHLCLVLLVWVIFAYSPYFKKWT